MMRFVRILITVFVGWYLILALGHYFNQRPLWNDELCVLKSIVQLKPSELFTRPLLVDQDFPRLYLFTIQQFSRVFHQNLLSLRFFSLVAMLGAFLVWFKIAEKLLGVSWGLFLFVMSWCGSMPLVYYAAELKPYSMDVLACGLIVLFLLEQDRLRENSRHYRLILLLLPLLGLWSYPSLFLLLLPLGVLVLDCLHDRRHLSELFLYLVSSVLILGLVYAFDFRISHRGLMEIYWHDYFISFHSWQDFFNSFGKGINNLIGRRFAENPHWVKIPSRFFIGMGLVYMFMAWRKQPIACISFIILLLQLLLASLRVFPLGVPRLSLFFTPLLLIMTIMAMNALRGRFKIGGSIVQLLFIAYLGFVSTGIAWNVFKLNNLGAESPLFGLPHLNQL